MAAGDGITVRTIMVSTKATARSKTNFSVLHLRAAHAAREAYEIEQPQYGDWFLEMYRLVTVSIVMAAAALEANANEIVQDNLDAEKRGAVQITDGQRLLEQFPIRRNRRGFSNRHRSDSSCVLAKEAGMHGPSAFP